MMLYQSGQAEKPLSASENAAFDVGDPLLVCLAIVAQLLDRPAHLPSLRAGFAVDDRGRVPRESFPDMARRHRMIAAWSRTRPGKLPGYVLPTIIPFIDGRACVLRSISGGVGRVLLPESGMSEMTMDIAELDSLAMDEVLVVKAMSENGDQTLVPLQGAAFGWFWGTLWRFRHFYVESILATVVANVLTLAGVFFAMNVYDRVVPTQAYTSLWTLAIGTTVAVVLEFIMRWLKARLVDLGGKKADLAINSTLLREIMSIRLENRPQSIGNFSSSMRDFESLRDFFSSASFVMLTDLPFAILFLALIWAVGGPLVLIPAVAILIVLVVAFLAQRPLMKAMRENMKENGDRQSVLVESLLNLEILKAHNAEGYLQRRWEVSNLLGAESYKKIRAISNFILGFTVSLQQLVTMAMIVTGVYLIHANQLTLGALIASVILAGRAISPMGSVMGLAARFQQAVTSLDVLDGLMKRPRDRDVGRTYVVPEVVKGELELADIEFSYPGPQRIPVVQRVSCTIASGGSLALLGRLGSGKSTILRLAAGLYLPSGGQVRIDGVDLRQLEPASFRDRIGYVAQDPQLFMGTLRENLVLANTWISDASIVEVLKRIDFYDAVSRHPLGLDMPLTEAGGGLSNGQRQLLAVARLMLRDPAIVFLDEPTSNMDQNSESRVIGVLKEWMKGRTLVLVTHRPQLLELVERIAVVDAGRLLAIGQKQEMIERLAAGIDVKRHDTQVAA